MDFIIKNTFIIYLNIHNNPKNTSSKPSIQSYKSNDTRIKMYIQIAFLGLLIIPISIIYYIHNIKSASIHNLKFSASATKSSVCSIRNRNTGLWKVYGAWTEKECIRNRCNPYPYNPGQNLCRCTRSYQTVGLRTKQCSRYYTLLTEAPTAHPTSKPTLAPIRPKPTSAPIPPKAHARLRCYF